MKAGVTQRVVFNQEKVKNIYHQLKYKTIGIQPLGGFYKTVLIPFREVGEIEGNVVFKNGERPYKVTIYDMDNTRVASTKIESDGYFRYLGLVPGKYYAKIDIENINTDDTITPFELLKNSVDGAYLGVLEIIFNK